MTEGRSADREFRRSYRKVITTADQESRSPALIRTPNKRLKLQQANLGVSPIAATPSLAARVEIERKRLFQAISILECCRNATATLFEVSDSEYMAPAFEVIHDLLNTSAAGLELVAAECEIPRC